MVEVETTITGRHRKEENLILPLMPLLRPTENDPEPLVASLRSGEMPKQKATIRESYMIIEIDRVYGNGISGIPLYPKIYAYAAVTVGASDQKQTFKAVFGEQITGYSFELASNDNG